MSEELVLATPAGRLEPYLRHFAGGLLQGPFVVAQLFEDVLADVRFVPRAAAEQDPAFKQLIPYCVLYREAGDGRSVFGYKRTKAGGEGRLHDRYSVGVGGHVNPEDGAGDADLFAYNRGLARELAEEVGLVVKHLAPFLTPKAVIYDPSNAVGRVHLGFVHFVRVPAADAVRPADPAVGGAAWYSRQALRQPPVWDGLESWSRILVGQEVLP